MPKLVLDQFNGGTHCYAVTPRAAQLLARVNSPTCFSADEFLGVLSFSQTYYGHLKIARTKKSHARQNPKSASDIEPYYFKPAAASK
jgi:hypothetical protein